MKLEMLELQKAYSGISKVFVDFVTCVYVHLHQFYSSYNVKKEGETETENSSLLLTLSSQELLKQSKNTASS